MSDQTERYLVLCVDRDDDLGTKAKVQSPVVGREEAVTAATKLALSDPEEADMNAMFSAIKKFDQLVSQGMDCEVAIVCGDSRRGFDSDRNVKMQVDSVLKRTGATGIVFVSDGGEDEQVIPVLQGLKPIVSVQRVTVKHSESVEESYLVLGRYLRMLVFDPHYSKWTLGVPGLILLAAGILIISHQVLEAELATLLIVGGVFIIRGFNVDRTTVGLLQRGPTGYMRFFTMVISLLVTLAGVFTGYDYMQDKASSMISAVAVDPSLFLAYGAKLTGYMISGSLALVWAGLAIYTTGALLSHVARDSVRWRRDGYVLLLLALLYFPVQTFSAFLIGGAAESSFLLISYALLGLAAIFALTVTIYPRVRTTGASANE